MFPIEVFHKIILQDILFHEGVPEHLRTEPNLFEKRVEQDSNAEPYLVAYLDKDGIINYESPEKYKEKQELKNKCDDSYKS